MSSNIHKDSNRAQGNMPGEYDSTSSGGYGTSANVWSQRAQRGFDNTNPASANAMGAYTSTSTDPTTTEVGREGVQREKELPSKVDEGTQEKDSNWTGLIDQSLSGGDLKHEMQDAGWGRHEREAEPGEEE
ncbi:hypothetical protein FA13DRAFT_1733399 [Coprinellus micaceus]|uniref:Uncharacterized protein n=1 Tax=Coprinellus micaceus TaxID=71717 RepID=A0A4Y7T9B2_COPMI|nr:hypothetical protein FA13DRAFT_1733399 [Coprinellus micaceus]